MPTNKKQRLSRRYVVQGVMDLAEDEELKPAERLKAYELLWKLAGESLISENNVETNISSSQFDPVAQAVQEAELFLQCQKEKVLFEQEDKEPAYKDGSKTQSTKEKEKQKDVSKDSACEPDQELASHLATKSPIKRVKKSSLIAEKKS